VKPGCTHAAADVIPHTTDVRLFSFERELLPLDELLSLYSVIGEIPRQILNITLFLDRAQKGLTRVRNMYNIDIFLICI
jgi:hypothetical protein